MKEFQLCIISFFYVMLTIFSLIYRSLTYIFIVQIICQTEGSHALMSITPIIIFFSRSTIDMLRKSFNSFSVHFFKGLVYSSFHQGLSSQRLQEWSRGVKDEKFMTPREDKRAPDLYIPVMALVTYMLLLSYIQGATGKFTARHLSVLCSSTIGLLLFEVNVTPFVCLIVCLSIEKQLTSAIVIPMQEVIEYDC